jgi:hypothetical protein
VSYNWKHLDTLLPINQKITFHSDFYSIRSYSSSSAPRAEPNFVPEKSYLNADILKQDILKENKQKSGVYR